MNTNEPLAVIGIGCRFPNEIDDPEKLWHSMINKEDAISSIPSQRWDVDSFCSKDKLAKGKINSFEGGFLKNITEFDPGFFNISPIEAKSMDPQQRLVLESSYYAIEDAGLQLEKLSGKYIGVFVGACFHDYEQIVFSYGAEKAVGMHTNIGLASSIISNRVSYSFNFKGPSMTIDTACSSALSAAHIGIQSLRNDECELALIGGVNVIIKPHMHIGFSQGGFLSPESRCKTFDKQANGYVRSEGAGVVVVKRLSKAIKDGDRIYSQIISSTINQDGKTQGISMPSEAAQINMLKKAYGDLDIDYSQIKYIEAHGTGTQAGDLNEANSLGKVLGVNKSDPLYIGSIKTNIGHLESASGIAGLIKAILVLYNRSIPPNLHFKEGNPNIDFSGLNIKVPTEETKIISGDAQCIAGVNSFGFGGSNAHLVLAEHKQMEDAKLFPISPENNTSDTNIDPYLFVLSAANQNALSDLKQRYINHIENSRDSIENICYSSLFRRSHLLHRWIAVVKDKTELKELLSQSLNDDFNLKQTRQNKASNSEKSNTVFVFSGQGSQWWGMARGLINNLSSFRDCITEISNQFKKMGLLLDSNSCLIDELLKDENDSRIDETIVAQPAIFAVQVALTRIWKEFGVYPDIVIGHSIGEIAAAHVSGALTLAEACRIVYHRCYSQAKFQGAGKMVAVGLNELSLFEQYFSILEGIDIAAYNGQELITLSGKTDSINALMDKLSEDDVFFREIAVDIPFHSYIIEPLKEEFINTMGLIAVQESKVPFYSTVTAEVIEGQCLDSQYWYNNIREPVKFQPVIKNLINSGSSVFVEIGAHPILSRYIYEELDSAEKDGIILASLRRGENDYTTMLTSVGELFSKGYPVDLSYFNKATSKYVELPHYPWQKDEHWIETDEFKEKRIGRKIHPQLINLDTKSIDNHVSKWKVDLDVKVDSFLLDHKVQDTIVYPGAGQIELVLSAVSNNRELPVLIENIDFKMPIRLSSESSDSAIYLEFNENMGEASYQISSVKEGNKSDWINHSSGKVNYLDEIKITNLVSCDEIRKRLTNEVDISVFYSRLHKDGLQLGPSFAKISKINFSDNEALTEISLDHYSNIYDKFFIHPGVLDSCIQSGFVFQHIEKYTNGMYIPSHIDQLKFFKRPVGKKLLVYTRQKYIDTDKAIVDIIIFNDRNEIIGEILNYRAAYLKGSCGENSGDLKSLFYQYEWIPESTILQNISYEVENKTSDQATWLVFCDSNGVSESFIAGLDDKEHSLILVNKGMAFNRKLANVFEVNPSKKEDISELISYLVEENKKIEHICYFWANDTEKEVSHSSLPQDQTETVLPLVYLIQSMSTAGWSNLTYLWIVTSGSESIQNEITDLSQSPIWGLGRVIINEHPEFYTRLVDLSLKLYDEEILTLIKHIEAERESSFLAEEIAIRGKSKYFHKLSSIHRMSHNPSQIDKFESYSVNPPDNGLLDDLELSESKTRKIGSKEVLIDNLATGLNYRDILLATNQLPSDARTGGILGNSLGIECSGIIRNLGKDVKGFEIGDEVIAFGPTNISNRVHADYRLCVHKPEKLNFFEAVSIFNTYYTAYYSLVHLGRLKKGEKVLIHGAAGGVGIAAIQIVLKMGAEVYATASPKKHDFLRSIGVTNIYNSRSLNFKDQILQSTEGYGVDIVLNSIAGKSIHQSLKCLAPLGRFVELGKMDTNSNARIGLELLKRNCSFLIVDLDRFPIEESNKFLKKSIDFFNSNGFPSHPHKLYPVSKIKEAFQYFMQGQHIGKIVIDMRKKPKYVAPSKKLSIDTHGTYLIPGGNSGVGLAIAYWLSLQGVKKLCIASRSGIKNVEDEAIVRVMENHGTEVEVKKMDVTSFDAVNKLIKDINSSHFPLKGIIHTAAILEDKLISSLDEASYFSVFSPKAIGAWNLHKASLSSDLDLFVCFSSSSSLYGPSGQANYCAANAFLDSLAVLRRKMGLNATTINWGLIGEVGMATKSTIINEITRNLGLKFLKLRDVFAIFEKILTENPINRCAVNINWESLKESAPNLAKSFRFLSLFDLYGSSNKEHAGKDNDQDKLFSSQETHPDAIKQNLKKTVARITGNTVEKIDDDHELILMGLDSLMANQLRVWILNFYRVDYSIMKILGGITINELVREIGFLVENSQKATTH
jgi:acyl transferase domain-containing protein/NADPH:quinone reductase-like Zn-dependent oxidoreductase/aryl carrier-like protein